MPKPLPLNFQATSAARQEVSVLFADVVGSTALAHALPLEAYSALMTELLQVLILGCAARGGEVLQHQGDAVVAVWPAWQAAFALEAAFESHGRVASLAAATRHGLKLQLRVGVASGEVIIGTVGSSVTAYGLPMNFARRLCDAADAGATLTCAQTQRLTPRATYLSAMALTIPDFPFSELPAQVLLPPSNVTMKIS
ncbi:adenylate/guanylate cyclase domain-containing protein [Deinococcus peraridilitoris]|uniref:Family 3 adenylate cyclase n=1 Tax=Deinococcus peraridilitoris (strain DSM 19664 / LMG 22246 / CIP 109416 / KR-200) TaxID=937777 RepID=K9ZZY6_DEIPD|nr:adenylate/guanylate cyclase domain-containing protein [Deinococcus peraridilitoris]AFZ67141.1 family 3 adenylate cyclase [Deinococcus peraridilitoris DSM 19664]